MRPGTTAEAVGAAGGPAARRSSPLRAAGWGLWRVAVWLFPLALVLVAWQQAVTWELIGNEFVAPPPGRVVEAARLLLADGTLQRSLGDTTARVLGSFGLAALVGVVLGLLIGRVRLVRLALRPLMSFLFPVPKLAIYPSMLIIFGPGSASKVAIGFAAAMFPILFATAAASSSVEEHLEWSARALGASKLSSFVSVVVPASLPGILTGMRIGLVGAIITVFLGEMVSAPTGLGSVTSQASNNLRIAEMYVGIVAIALTGLLLDRALLLVRRWLLAWSPEGATDVRAG